MTDNCSVWKCEGGERCECRGSVASSKHTVVVFGAMIRSLNQHSSYLYVCLLSGGQICRRARCPLNRHARSKLRWILPTWSYSWLLCQMFLLISIEYTLGLSFSEQRAWWWRNADGRTEMMPCWLSVSALRIAVRYLKALFFQRMMIVNLILHAELKCVET